MYLDCVSCLNISFIFTVKCFMPRRRQRIQRLSNTQVASALGVTRQTLHNWIKSGRVQAPLENSVPGYFRWTPAEVEGIRMTIQNKEEA